MTYPLEAIVTIEAMGGAESRGRIFDGQQWGRRRAQCGGHAGRRMEAAAVVHGIFRFDTGGVVTAK